MKRFALVVAVMILAMMCILGGHGLEGQAHGALTRMKTPVPAITHVSPTTKGQITIWRGWITIIFPDGRRVSGYADWRGYPDSVPLWDSYTNIYSGSGMNWHLLSDKEKSGISVILVEIDLGYGNGPYKPGSSATGL